MSTEAQARRATLDYIIARGGKLGELARLHPNTAALVESPLYHYRLREETKLIAKTAKAYDPAPDDRFGMIHAGVLKRIRATGYRGQLGAMVKGDPYNEAVRRHPTYKKWRKEETEKYDAYVAKPTAKNLPVIKPLSRNTPMRRFVLKEIYRAFEQDGYGPHATAMAKGQHLGELIDHPSYSKVIRAARKRWRESKKTASTSTPQKAQLQPRQYGTKEERELLERIREKEAEQQRVTDDNDKLVAALGQGRAAKLHAWTVHTLRKHPLGRTHPAVNRAFKYPFSPELRKMTAYLKTRATIDAQWVDDDKPYKPPATRRVGKLTPWMQSGVDAMEANKAAGAKKKSRVFKRSAATSGSERRVTTRVRRTQPGYVAPTKRAKAKPSHKATERGHDAAIAQAAKTVKLVPLSASASLDVQAHRYAIERLRATPGPMQAIARHSPNGRELRHSSQYANRYEFRLEQLKRQSTKEDQTMATKKTTRKKAPTRKKATRKKAPVRKKATTRKKAPVRKKATTRKKAPVRKKAPTKKVARKKVVRRGTRTGQMVNLNELVAQAEKSGLQVWACKGALRSGCGGGAKGPKGSRGMATLKGRKAYRTVKRRASR